jgi:alkylation response protein AidB-like acyl-CoA dehydrogenase
LAFLGYNALAAAAITLKEVPLESTQIIGPFSDEAPLQELRAWEDQTLAAAGLGLMQRSFDAAREFAKNHQSGGKPIIAYQEIGFKLAEMLTLLQTSQLLAYRAAWMDAAGDPEARIVAHCAKVFCSESAEAVASHALEILGGRGFVRGNPAEESYRDAKYLQIAGTSTEISRMKIGDRLLGTI